MANTTPTPVGNQSLVSNEARDRVRGIARPIALAMGRIGLTPNGLTLIGFVGTCIAAVVAAGQLWLAAGILVIAFGIFDMFDGALARATNRTSAFGAFLDSTLDRTGESLVLTGVAYACATLGFAVGAGLAAAAIAFASVVTYSRAKAEVIGLKGDVGIAPRPERLVILAVGLAGCGLFGGLESAGSVGGSWGGFLGYWPTGGGTAILTVALALITVLSAITVVQRILVVRRQLDRNVAQ
jgi:CDP-diacylglycerol--glycerol-3-phosphate 3-phosphatidyltransferase